MTDPESAWNAYEFGGPTAADIERAAFMAGWRIGLLEAAESFHSPMIRRRLVDVALMADHEEGANLAARPQSAGRWRARHEEKA